MAVRILLVLAAFAVLYGCGQASSPPERQEKQRGVEESKPKEGKEQATVKCEDFISREAAQEYFDTRATKADRAALDPDDNGQACDEGGYAFAPEPTTPSSASASSQASGSVSGPGASGEAIVAEGDQRQEKPKVSVSSPGASSEVVVAAGDIAACDSSGDEATAKLLSGRGGTVLTLGDAAYPRGSVKNFNDCYEPSWGRFKGRTKPVPGNHEYETKRARGYFDYFGDVAGEPGQGYYSYDLAEWHLLALNSNCQEVGGCADGSPQLGWLREDLATNNDVECTLAYFHYPLFTSGKKRRPGFPEVKPLWEALYAAGADVVLSAHDHNYQRFAPQNPEGEADRNRGIRQFVVGTGGANLYAIANPIGGVEVYNDETNGVLKLTLRSKSYAWRFISAEGEGFTDSGKASCH
jgi:hypothetical protein